LQHNPHTCTSGTSCSAALSEHNSTHVATPACPALQLTSQQEFFKAEVERLLTANSLLVDQVKDLQVVQVRSVGGRRTHLQREETDA
jgi:hypothetical protein